MVGEYLANIFYIRARRPYHLLATGAGSMWIVFRSRVHFGVRGCTLITEFPRDSLRLMRELILNVSTAPRD
jgi:hypothetical protein